jgi:uncharacterized protein YaiI (UPF0178 family)
MSNPTLWIDADACPREAKQIIFRFADRLEVKTVLVANSDMTVPRSRFVSTVRVGQGLNVADDYIARTAAPGDVAVTADIPLAAQLVPRGVIVVDPRGELYTDDNIQERLSIRNFMQEAREAGVQTGGPRSHDARATQQFANALDRVLTRVARKAAP